MSICAIFVLQIWHVWLLVKIIENMDSKYQMSAASNQEGGDGSDMDEPMASQGQVRISDNWWDLGIE